jgi:CHAT domain-containing protein/tetratricopeptide (TPR) repeat protein
MKKWTKNIGLIILKLILLSNFLKAQDFQKLLNKLESELELYLLEEGSDPLTIARAYNKIAKLHFYQKSYQEALINFELELKHYLHLREADNVVESKIRAYHNAAGLNRLLGNYSKAYSQAQKSLYWSIQHYGEGDKETTDAYKLLAEIAMFWKRYDLQLHYSEKALESLNNQQHRDSSKLVDLLLLKAVYYLKTGTYGAGATLLSQAKEIEQEVALSPKVRAKLYTDLGVFYEFQSQYIKALSHYRKALEIRLEDAGERQLSVAWLWDNMGVVFSKIEDHEMAIKYFDQAYQLTEELLGSKHPRTLDLIAHKAAALVKKKPEEAIKLLKKQLKDLKISLGPHCKEQIFALQKLASIAYQQQDYQRAAAYAEEVERLYQKYPQSLVLNFAIHYYNQALYYDKLSKAKLSLQYYQKSLRYNRIQRTDEKVLFWRPILAIKTAGAILSLGPESSDGIRLIKEQLDLLSAEISKQQFRPDQESLLEVSNNFLDAALSFLMPLNRKDIEYKNLVYSCFASSKAVLLAESLNFREICNEIGLAASDQGELQRAITNEELYQKQWLEAELSADSLKIASTYQWLKTAEAQRQAAMERLKSSFPVIKQHLSTSNNISLEEFISSLQANECFLSYFEGDSLIYRLVITQKDWEFSMIKQSSLSKLDEFILALREQQTNFWDAAQYQEVVRPISNALLPTQSIINKVNRLIIAPDGRLNYLPFELLLLDKTETKASYKELPYCIRRYKIVYQIQRPRSQSTKHQADSQILGFYPQYEDELELKGAKEEVKYLAQHYIGDYYYQGKLKKSDLKQKMKDYSVLHLAMHAIAADSAEAYLKLAKGDKIKMAEVASLNLQDCKLLVLSACQTGLGTYQKGEGVMSLGRAFLESGVESELISLWSISDQATLKLLKQFYEQLSKGLEKDEALRLAKLDFIQSASRVEQQPTYWAGLVLWGNTEAIELPKASFSKKCYYLWGILLSTLLILAVSSLYFFKNKK